MTRDDDFIGQLENYLDEFEGDTPMPDAIRDAIRAELPAIHQRPAWWPGWRFPQMNTNLVRVGLAAAAVVVVAFLGIRFMLPGQNLGDPGPTPIPSATPLAVHEGALAAGTYIAHPFADAGGGWGACPEPTGPDCDPTVAADISLTFTVPDGWAQYETGENVFWQADEHASAPDGASLLFMRGSWLASDPCAEETPDIPVGPTVDDFANALADHPLLDTTAPVDVTLDGYSGKYLDLQTPADRLLTGCAFYRPWDPGIYAQGPGQRWHIWILDVDGIRIVIHADDYAETSPQLQAELQSIVDSIQIEP